MVSTHRRSLTGQSGITLIELLVSMIILGIISTMLIVGWINLQRSTAFALTTNNARATARDSISRVTNELRASQPTALVTPSPSATATPAAQPPITQAGKWDVQFYSAYNDSTAAADGTGVATLRLTRIYLDTATVPPAPWNPSGRTLRLQRDTNRNGWLDSADMNIILARNVVNMVVADATNGTSPGTTYTPLFKYAYRASASDPIQWTDNTAGTLDLSTIVAVRTRIIIDANARREPNAIDATTTVRLRNASGS